MRRLNDKYRHHFYLCAILAVFLLRGHPCVADEDDLDVEHFDAFGEIDGLTKPCTDHGACGATGACCQLGLNKDDPLCEFGNAGCAARACCVLATTDFENFGIDVANQGESCFEEERGLCSFDTGKCDEQCGSQGACCQMGKGISKACGSGTLGCHDRHCCVRNALSKVPSSASSSDSSWAHPFNPRELEIDVRLCDHDNATHPRFNAREWRATGGFASLVGDTSGGVPSWSTGDRGDIIGALVEAAIGPWKRRLTRGGRSLTYASIDASIKRAKELDSTLRRFVVLRLDRGYATVWGSFLAPDSGGFSRASTKGDPPWVTDRARQVMSLGARLAAKRPNLSVEMVISLSDCVCTRNWKPSNDPRASAQQLQEEELRTNEAPLRRCNANYRSMAPSKAKLSRAARAGSEAEELLPMFTAVACLDSDDIPIPIFSSGYRAASRWYHDSFKSWPSSVAELDSSFHAGERFYHRQLDGASGGAHGAAGAAIKMHSRLHPIVDDAAKDSRVVYRGDLSRSNCKVGVAGRLCGHAKFAWIASHDNGSSFFDAQPLGTPSTPPPPSVASHTYSFVERRVGSVRDYPDIYRHALVMENFCGWNAQLKSFLWLNIGVLMQETFCAEYFTRGLEPWVHYIPVDYDLKNLAAAARWARANPRVVTRIVGNAHRFAEAVLTRGAMERYFERLAVAYAALFENTSGGSGGVRPPHPDARPVEDILRRFRVVDRKRPSSEVELTAKRGSTAVSFEEEVPQQTKPVASELPAPPAAVQPSAVGMGMEQPGEEQKPIQQPPTTDDLP